MDGRWRQIRVTAVDETSKIDLNSANEVLLKGPMMQVGELDVDAAARIVDAILDWRDPDDLRRPNGAEQADYLAAKLKSGPGNAPFVSVGEFGRVLGVTPELLERVSRSLTVYSRQAGINPATASRGVLLALPNATRRSGRQLHRGAHGRARGTPGGARLPAGAGLWRRRSRRSGGSVPKPCCPMV